MLLLKTLDVNVLGVLAIPHKHILHRNFNFCNICTKWASGETVNEIQLSTWIIFQLQNLNIFFNLVQFFPREM